MSGSRLQRRLDRRPTTRAVDTTTAHERLQDLRDKLAACMAGDTRPRAARPARTSHAARLVLDTRASADGTLHVRRNLHPRSSLVGEYRVGAALDACMTTLSLLALTPTLAGCRPTRALFLDTETTGFGNGTGNVAFLVGMAWFDAAGAQLVSEQLFLREPSDEPALLAAVRARIEWADCVVSYNGKSFDLPLLRGRLVMNRMAALPERPQLDLLHLARRVHRHRSWPKKLSRLEVELLGFRRGHDVDGEEVAQRYLHYLRSGDDVGLEDVLVHNARDVLSLAALTGVYGEPLERPADELAAMARVLRRAGDLERAGELAELAVERGAGAPGLWARAQIAKARGDKWQALEDFEALAQQLSDPDVRLELAKLYEHFLKQPGRALAMVELGTGEGIEAQSRRRARLTRKLSAHLEAGAASTLETLDPSRPS